MSPSGPEWLKHMACSVSVQSGKLQGRRANVCVENECILSVCVCAQRTVHLQRSSHPSALLLPSLQQINRQWRMI